MITRQIWRDFNTWGWDARQHAQSTRDLYGRRCRAAERWLHPTSLYRATADDVKRWHTSLPATPSSRNIGRQSLVAFYDFAIDRNIRAANPARDLPSFRYPDSVPRSLNANQAAQVMDATTNPEWRFAMSLLFHTALRCTEARTLQWTSVQDEWVQVTVKGGRERIIPLHPHTLAAMATWRESCPSPSWMFPSPQREGPRSDTSFRQHVKRTAAEAGVTMVPHMARHTVATRMAEVGVNVRLIQDLLGHRSLATTQRYLRARPTLLTEAVRALDLTSA